MSRTKFLNFLKEARALLPYANAQQKIKLIALIKENIKKIEKDSSDTVVLVESNSDYLSER